MAAEQLYGLTREQVARLDAAMRTLRELEPLARYRQPEVRSRVWQIVRATSLTPTTDGLYPGKIVRRDETQKTWVDEADIWIRAPFVPPKTTAKLAAELCGVGGGRGIYAAAPGLPILGRLHSKRDKGLDTSPPGAATGIYSYAWYPDGGSSAELTGKFGRWTATKTQTANGVDVPEKWTFAGNDVTGGQVRFGISGGALSGWEDALPSAGDVQAALGSLGLSVTVVATLPNVFEVTYNDFVAHTALTVDNGRVFPPPKWTAEEVNGWNVPLDTWVFLFYDHADDPNIAITKTQTGNGTSLPTIWSIVKENIAAGGWQFTLDTVTTGNVYSNATTAEVKAALDAAATGGVTFTVTGAGTTASPWIVTSSGFADHDLSFTNSTPANLSSGGKYKFEHIPPIVGGATTSGTVIQDVDAYTEGPAIGIVFSAPAKALFSINQAPAGNSYSLSLQSQLDPAYLPPSAFHTAVTFGLAGYQITRVLPDAEALAKDGTDPPPAAHLKNYRLRLNNTGFSTGTLDWEEIVTAVNGANITAGTVPTAALADGAVTDPKLADGAVIAAKIPDGEIGTAKLGGDITAAGTALLDDADATAQKATLGLGTLADLNPATDTADPAALTGTGSAGGSYTSTEQDLINALVADMAVVHATLTAALQALRTAGIQA